MRCGRFASVEGAGASMVGGGSKERVNFSSDKPMMRHLPGSTPPDMSNKFALSRRVILTFGVVSLSQSSCCTDFSYTKERRLVVRELACLSVLTVCLLLHCIACFSLSCLSYVRASSTTAADIHLFTTSVGINGDAAEPFAAGETEHSASEIGAPAERTTAILPPPVTASAGVEHARPAAADVKVSNDVAPSSLLSTKQEATMPGRLPAGYQTYREMLRLLRTLAGPRCPELELRERRNGQLKLDVITLRRRNRSSSSNREMPSQQEQRIFILTGEHPRELLPPAVLLRFIQLMCGVQQTTPSDVAGLAEFAPPSTSFPSAVAGGRQQQRQQEEGGEATGEKGDKTEEQEEEKSNRGQGKGQKGKGEEEEEQSNEGHKEGKEDEEEEDAGDEEQLLSTQVDTSWKDSRGSATQSEEDGEDDNNPYRRLLDSAEFQIILNANPSARDKVEQGEYCRRGTLSNVDLNRNWGAFWEAGTREQSEPAAAEGTAAGGKAASLEYLTGGPSPFSEPETQLVKQLLLKFRPTLFISVHSGSLGAYTPFGYADQQPLKHAKRLQQIANSIAQSPGCRNVDSSDRCVSGTAGQYFAAKGNCLDWVYTNIRPTPLAFLLEIYRGFPAASSPSQKGAGEGTRGTEGVEQGEHEEKQYGNAGRPPAGSPPEARPLQRFAFAQDDAQGPAAPPTRLSGVRTPENEFGTEQKSLGRQLHGASHQARVSPHFQAASFRERSISWLQSKARLGRDRRHSLEGASVSPNSSAAFDRDSHSSDSFAGSPVSSNICSPFDSKSHSSGRKSSRRSVDVDTGAANSSFLETRAAASATAHDAVGEQLFSGVYTPQECFRMFNPRTPHSREKAVHNWVQVLLQLIEEVQASSEAEE